MHTQRCRIPQQSVTLVAGQAVADCQVNIPDPRGIELHSVWTNDDFSRCTIASILSLGDMQQLRFDLERGHDVFYNPLAV